MRRPPHDQHARIAGVGRRRLGRRLVDHPLVALARQTMTLDRTDLIYLSPFMEVGGTDYQRWAWESGIRPPSRKEMTAEARRLTLGIREGGTPAKTAYYALEHFVY